MDVPRQEKSSDGGRVNQKRRTRRAIVDAARMLLRSGTTPSVAEAAAAAEVSRTTAYRYFPTQEALLTELAMGADVDDIEELVSRDVDAADAPTRAIEVLEQLNQHVTRAEVEYRAALRLYLDQWLTERAGGTESPQVREGRRTRWFEASLAPLRSQVSDEEWRRVVAGLSLLGGAEARVVLCDVCGLDDDELAPTVRWIAETLLTATFGEAQGTAIATRQSQS